MWSRKLWMQEIHCCSGVPICSNMFRKSARTRKIWYWWINQIFWLNHNGKTWKNTSFYAFYPWPNSFNLPYYFSRELWADYFREQNLKAVFFSAIDSMETRSTSESADDFGDHQVNPQDGETNEASDGEESADDEWETDESATEEESDINERVGPPSSEDGAKNFKWSSKIYSRTELVGFLKRMYGDKPTVIKGLTTVGFVSYPVLYLFGSLIRIYFSTRPNTNNFFMHRLDIPRWEKAQHWMLWCSTNVWWFLPRPVKQNTSRYN